MKMKNRRQLPNNLKQFSDLRFDLAKQWTGFYMMWKYIMKEL